MKNIVRIFRKDIRHLWPYSLVFLVMVVLAACLDPTYTVFGASSFWMLDSVALPLAGGVLVVVAIHEEKLPGDRQYWLTRPIARKELLGAKLLFVLVFIHLPLFLYHAAVLRAVAIPLWGHLPELLWRQVFFAAFYVLPVAAIASITRRLGHVILMAVLIFLPAVVLEEFFFSRYRGTWGGLDWVLSLAVGVVLAAGAGLTLYLQYRERRTGRARVVLAGTLALLVLVPTMTPPAAAIALRDALSRADAAGNAVQITMDPNPMRRPLVRDWRLPDVAVEIPLKVEGLAQGQSLFQGAVSAYVAIQGTSRKVEGQVREGALALYVPKGLFLSARDTTAEIYGQMELTMFGAPETRPLPGARPVVVPGIGACWKQARLLACYTTSPRAALTVDSARGRIDWVIPRGLVETHFPTIAGFQPVERFSDDLVAAVWDTPGEAWLSVSWPVAHIERTFLFQNVRLREYAGVGR